jgi:hypothetical protein
MAVCKKRKRKPISIEPTQLGMVENNKENFGGNEETQIVRIFKNRFS